MKIPEEKEKLHFKCTFSSKLEETVFVFSFLMV